MSRSTPKLRRRFNKNGTVSLYSGSLVVFKHSDLEACQAFARGWYGDCPVVFGKKIS